MAENIRAKGTAIFAVNLEPTGASPLDARLLVEDMDMLLAETTYPDNNMYAGMPVIVKTGESGKSELWVLRNPGSYMVKESWQRLDADAAAINDSIKDAVESLDATVGATAVADGEHVAVQVVQENGKLTGLTVTESDIASKAALEAEVIRAKAAEKANADTIADMNLTDAVVDGQFVTTVSQTDGKVAITRGEVASDKVTAKPINGDDTVTIEGNNVDAQIQSLGKTLKTVQDNAAKYKVVKLTDAEAQALPDGANVKEAYRVVSYTGADAEGTIYTKVGEDIKIYKDGNLKSAELGTGADAQKLILTYTTADGTDATVKVDFAAIAFNTEFKDGLQVATENGEISVKVDGTSENFLTVGADGIKLAGVQSAIDNTIAAKIRELDATEGEATVTDGKHVAVQVVETDGKITAVNVAEDDIASKAALETEVNRAKAAEDKIESSVGLAADGSFIVPAGKNYIDGATTVMDAVEKLDAQIKLNTEAIAAGANALDNLDVADTVDPDKFVTGVSQTDGKIAVSRGLVNANKVFLSTVGEGTTALAAKDVQAGILELLQKMIDGEKVSADAIAALVKVLGGNAIEETEDGYQLSYTNDATGILEGATSFSDADEKLAAAIASLSATKVIDCGTY